jgi:hypothetical protein
MYPRAIPAKFGSLPSRMTCRGASRSLRIFSVKSGDHNGQGGQSLIQPEVDFPCILENGDDVEIGGGIKFSDQITTDSVAS